MKKVKIILTILTIILFVSNYAICNYFYPTDSDSDVSGWWGLKSNLYAVIVALAFLSANIGAKGVVRFFFSVGVGFALSNVIDKVYFNVMEFTNSDIYMIITTILISSFDFYKHSKYRKIP